MHRKNFLKLPEFPGGKLSFQKYIADNLKYPEKALQNSVEGIVHLSAEIDDNGQVSDIQVEKGIGFGCDEEAVRLLQSVRYGSVKNKGIRVKTHKKFRIEFRIKKENQQLQINYSVKKKAEPKTEMAVPSSGNRKYSYSIGSGDTNPSS
jgi:TonB family protein